jgi:hypothetical protein
MSLLNQLSDQTGDFLFADFANFGQGFSAYSLRLDSIVAGLDGPLSLTNTSRFDQAFFAQQSFLLSQIFITNDARINLFANHGQTDLNFSMEILPTRTVVQNPAVIVVAKPELNVPEALGAAPEPINNFVSLIQQPESRPLVTQQQPESFFQIRYTADDDGLFEEAFKWDDPNDDPDAIRAAIEGARLDDDDNAWPDTSEAKEGNWTERIKNQRLVKPGLYYIFEVQEGQEIPEPVDAPVDRSDLENLVEPDSENGSQDPVDSPVDESAANGGRSSDHNSESKQLSSAGTGQFSAVTRRAMLASSLLYVRNQLENDVQTSSAAEWASSDDPAVSFTRSARLWRKCST